MKIDLLPDRALRRPDPVEAAQGVFAHLEPADMSKAEALRHARVVPQDADIPIPAEIALHFAQHVPVGNW